MSFRIEKRRNFADKTYLRAKQNSDYIKIMKLASLMDEN